MGSNSTKFYIDIESLIDDMNTYKGLHDVVIQECVETRS